ncbi:MAG: BTAD domain-containing putative transcriptional regulator [Azonexus sp.]
MALQGAPPLSRKKLAALFWPDLPGEAALDNLRQVLLKLRHALNAPPAAPACLIVARDAVSINAAALNAFDVAEFLRPIPGKPSASPEQSSSLLTHMARQVTLYRGEFLAGFSLPECPEFEDWLQTQREALQRHALDLLNRLTDGHEQLGDYALALSFIQRYLELAPWDEKAHQRAMRLYARQGEGSKALAQYYSCCRILKNELGISPGEVTTRLAEAIRSEHCRPAASLPGHEEKRRVTVLYCELSVGELDDPDEAMELLQPARRHALTQLQKFSGHVVETYAGGVLAYFGYPQASEHAAHQALRAALAIIGTVFPGVAVRIGLHTGVIIAGGSLNVPDPLGLTTALAIRLRRLVGNGEIALSDECQRLAAGNFDCLSLGLQNLPGIARQLEAFQLLRETGARYRQPAARPLPPVIGRNKELATLQRLWAETCHGHKRSLLLSGEAGIGKSRLVLALKESLANSPANIVELHCCQEYRQSPWQPLIDCWETRLGPGTDTAEGGFARLAAYVETHFAELSGDAIPLLANLLGLPVISPYRPSKLAPQQLREASLAILLKMFRTERQLPLLLVVEDMHWIDPSTLELLERLAAADDGTPRFMLLTSRPGFQVQWLKNPLPILELNGLDEAELNSLLDNLAPALTAAQRRRIVERADGIPLFAEELAKSLQSECTPAIPATLHDLLAARLDSTGAARTIAQQAATIGRNFSRELLGQLSPLAPHALSNALQQLQEAGLLNSDAYGNWQFRHALMRDAAYQSQTRAGRQAVHLRIAEALLADHRTDTPPEIIAQHLTAGNESQLAIIHWLKAGHLAVRHSANQEAMLHFKAGLSLIERLDKEQDGIHLEFELQHGLALAAIACDGYASMQASAALARAQALCVEHEGSPEMFRSVWGLWASASSRAGYGYARKLADQLLPMAESSGDPVQLQQAHFALGNTLFWQGEFAGARQHLEQALALYEPGHHQRHVDEFGEDLCVTAGAYLSWVLQFLGEAEQAAASSRATLNLARQLDHPFSLAYALTFAAILSCRLHQAQPALALADETLAIADRFDFHLWQIGGQLARGWALAIQGEVAGVELISRCVEATRTAMSGVSLLVLAAQGRALLLQGSFAAGLTVIDEAIGMGILLGDRHIDAELLCLRGEALLGLSPANRAEAADCFRQALQISRQQQAKPLESRAMSYLAG